MIAGFILAAGKGTRIKSKDRNKVTLPFLNKPLIVYSVELLQDIASKTIVVIGAFHESVKKVLRGQHVIYAMQKRRLGTAHAVKVAMNQIKKKQLFPTLVLVGYGDHTMFYKKQTVLKLIEIHKKNHAAVSLITTAYQKPNELAWGRVVRNDRGSVVDIVEQKESTEELKKVKELNAGFYCFDYKFLKNNINRIKKSPISKEYYITDMIKIALQQNKKVMGLKVPFSGVGIGINKYSELEKSQRIYLNTKKS